MDRQDRLAFVSAYTKVLTTAWSDDSYARRLIDDPTAAVAEFGLTVPADAHVVVLREPSPSAAEANLDAQVELWAKGTQTGIFELHVPESMPELATEELSDGDLMGVAAGDTGCCCCCCPAGCSSCAV